MQDQAATWFTDAKAYDGYIGRWSLVVAREFVDWLGVGPGGTWIDVACGTGALTQTILDRADPERIDGFDSSPQFLETAAKKIVDPRVSFRLADACELPAADASYDALVCGLAINAMGDQPRALSEFVRAVKPGGVVAVYVWDFDGKMEMLRKFWDAANELSGEVAEPSPPGFAISHPDRLREAFDAAGLTAVETRAVDAPTRFRDFDDFWIPFTAGPAPSQRHVASLTEERRSQLRERLRADVPIAADGSISLIARAWAAKGRKE